MKKKFIWVVVSGLVVVALLLAACAPAPAKETAPAAPVAPVVKEAAPVVKETAPAVKEAAPGAETNMIKVTLTKLDGTKVEKLVEKPQYGGILIQNRNSAILAWDEAYQAPWTLAASLSPTNEDLIIGDWTRGSAGTGEEEWDYGEWTSLRFARGELAESWEVADPQTIVFHLRKGVRWGLNPKSEASRLVNGREFTADDAVFNIKRIYFDIPTSTMYGMLGESRPTEVSARDKYTVVVKSPPLKIGDTLENIGNLTKMVPPEVVKKYGDMNKWENVVGTGPFMLVDYVPMSSATWVKNPNYWQKDPVLGAEYQLPYLDGFKSLIIPDRSTELAAIRTGKVDLSGTTWPLEDAAPLLKSRPELQSYKKSPGGCYPLSLGRMDKPELPTNDIRVRKALLMAINDQEILDKFLGGDGEIPTWKVAPTKAYKAAGWYTPLAEFPPEIKEIYTYNPVKAKQLLTEAGYPNGFKAEVVTQGTYPYIDYILMVKEYWKKNLNVELTLDVKEFGTFMSIYQRKTQSDMLISGRGGNVRSMYCVRKGNMYNWAMVDDPKAEQYYKDITAAYFDEPKLNKLVKEMNLYVLSQAWYWGGPRPALYVIWQPWLKNFHGENQLGSYSTNNELSYLWIDQELKQKMGH